MGWRSWNQFGNHINSTVIRDAARALVAKRGPHANTSLFDVGYTSIGIDEGWEGCGAGVNGTQHDAQGRPTVASSFSNMAQLVAEIHSLGVSAGWYQNGCKCGEKKGLAQNYAGDVASLHDFGFDAVKFDGCGAQRNLTLYAELMVASGKNFTVENCHWGPAGSIGCRADDDASSCPTKDWCPFNSFRTSGDIRPTYGSVLSNLLTAAPFNTQGVTGPRCWAYPDMLEVGVTHAQPPGAYYKCDSLTPHGAPDVPCALNRTEQQTHFAAWAITSAPLVLGLDVRNDTAVAEAWDIIANPEVIAISQAYAGDAGRLHSQSNESATAPNCGIARPCQVPAWTVFSKALPASRVAVLLMNNDVRPRAVSVNMSHVHGVAADKCRPHGCSVRDVWQRRLLTAREGGRVSAVAPVVSAQLQPHESRLVVISAST